MQSILGKKRKMKEKQNELIVGDNELQKQQKQQQQLPSLVMRSGVFNFSSQGSAHRLSYPELRVEPILLK